MTGTVLAVPAGLPAAGGWLGVLTGLRALERLDAVGRAAGGVAGRTSGPAIGVLHGSSSPSALWPDSAAFLAWVFHRTGNAMDWVWAQGAWGAIFKPLAFWARQYHAIDRSRTGGLPPSRDGSRRSRWPASCGCSRWPCSWCGAVSGCTPPSSCAIWARARRRPPLDRPHDRGALSGLHAAASTFKGRAFIIVATVFAAGQAYVAWRFFLWLPPF